MEDTSTKEFEACSAVHGPLQHLDPADLSFNGTGGPGRVSAACTAAMSLRNAAVKRASGVALVAASTSSSVSLLCRRRRRDSRWAAATAAAGAPRPAAAQRTFGRLRP